MHENHEIKKEQILLDEKGNIKEPGFAKKLYWKYDRKNIKAPKWRIKEWDYYYIGNQEIGLCLTISDSGFVESDSISLLKYTDPIFIYNDAEMGAFPLGKMNLPNTSVIGDLHCNKKRLKMDFINDSKTRHLYGVFHNYAKTGKTLEFDVTLSDIPEESMVIATPFNKKAHFYYNQKINCMKANGYVEFDGVKYEFNEKNGSLGTLDWGRGVWTYDNTWYWGSGQVVLDDGSRFGWNIGYGFGDTTKATENMLFYNGKSHKLSEVTFNIPKDEKGNYNYTDKWTFTSDDKRFEMEFTPILDRYDPVDLKIIAMIPHQVFGKISGKAVLDDGTVIEIKDKMCFAERVHNKW